MLTVTGSALVAFIDAVASALTADVAVSALATVYDALPRASSTTLPYVAFGRRSMLGDGFAMGRAGVDVTLEIDTWSEKNGPFEATLILGHVRRVLTRNDLRVSG